MYKPALVLVLVLSACAPVSHLPTVDNELARAEAEKQRELAFESFLGQSDRAGRVAFPILTANTELCGDTVTPTVGFTIATQRALPEDFRSAAKKMLGIDDNVTILAVVEGSPAALSGLQVGDRITAIDDWTVPTGRKAGERFADGLADNLVLGKATSFHINRGEQSHVLTVMPVEACDYPVAVSLDGRVNAFADGESVTITSGMMRFADTDEELANVIGHELAHNIMGHISKKTANAGIGLIFDVLAAGFGVDTGGAFSELGAGAFSQGFEAEADYAGLYLMARAGYDIESAPNFWRRMGAANPGAISLDHATSHPATPERFVALEQTVQEISNKRTNQLPLVPNTKKNREGQE